MREQSSVIVYRDSVLASVPYINVASTPANAERLTPVRVSKSLRRRLTDMVFIIMRLLCVVKFRIM